MSQSPRPVSPGDAPARPLNLPGPLVVGGVGGSGTRVVALMMERMGFYIGAYLNRADDNMWFDTLFSRPGWLRTASPETLRHTLTLFDRAMHDEPPGGALQVIVSAFDKGHEIVESTDRTGLRRWTAGTFHRAASLLRLTRPIDRTKYRAWGWKHPITHLYLPQLADFYTDMKFIMVIRNGLDMAFSNNSGQLRVWSWMYQMQPDSLSAANQLAFWVRANEATIAAGRERLGDRFLALNFDALCQQPESEVGRLLDFIGLDVPVDIRQELIGIPRVPASMGRHREHDLGQFDPADVEAVRRLGFSVGG